MLRCRIHCEWVCSLEQHIAIWPSSTPLFTGGGAAAALGSVPGRRCICCTHAKQQADGACWAEGSWICPHARQQRCCLFPDARCASACKECSATQQTGGPQPSASKPTAAAATASGERGKHSAQRWQPSSSSRTTWRSQVHAKLAPSFAVTAMRRCISLPLSCAS